MVGFLGFLLLLLCPPAPMMANTFMRNWQDTEPTTERSYTTGPSFASKDANITAIEGTDVQLVCKVFNLANKTVSWIRHENLHIISAGGYTYTSDERFQALTSADVGYLKKDSKEQEVDDGSEAWILRIRNVAMSDEGSYECQVSTQPVRSHFVYLRVVVPIATILGKNELFVDVGSTINITCVVRHTPGPQSIVQWKHREKPIDYTSSRGGVSVLTTKSATTISSLIIQRATAEDGGKYSCHAGELVKAAYIKVHVIHGDNYKHLQSNGSDLVVPLSSLSVAVFLIIFFTSLKYTREN